MLTGRYVDFLEGFEELHCRMQYSLKFECFILYVLGIPPSKIESLFKVKYGEGLKGFTVRNINNIYHSFASDGRDILSKIYNRQITKKYKAIYLDATYINTKNSKKTCFIGAVGLDGNNLYEVIDIQISNDGTESTESYRSFLQHLIDRGLAAPDIVIADGAHSVWSAVTEILPSSRHQACFIHKCRNIFQASARKLWNLYGDKFKEIYACKTKKRARILLHKFIETDLRKSKKLQNILLNSEDKLLTFFDFPADIRTQLYTSNPIETLFSMLKPRGRKTRGMMENENMMFIFQLIILTYGNKKNEVDVINEIFGFTKKLEQYSRELDLIMQQYDNQNDINYIETYLDYANKQISRTIKQDKLSDPQAKDDLEIVINRLTQCSPSLTREMILHFMNIFNCKW
jgi:transposase-like protein